MNEQEKKEIVRMMYKMLIHSGRKQPEKLRDWFDLFNSSLTVAGYKIVKGA